MESPLLLGRIRVSGTGIAAFVLLFTFLLSLLVRALYLLDLRGTPLTDVLLIDSETYDRLARLILTGSFRGEEVYAMNPLYPYFLSGVYALGEGSLWAVFAIQALLDAGSVVLLTWIGARWFGRRTALLAGVGAAIYGPLVFYTGTLLTPTLIVFLMLVTVAFLVRYQAAPRGGWALAAGLALGLAALGRGNNLLLVPLAFWYFGVHAGSRSRALRHGLVFTAGALLVVGAVTARNYLVEGKLVPISANFAAFYVGHHPGATGLYAMPDMTVGAGFEDEVWGTREAVSAREGRSLTLAETSEILFREGLEFAWRHPLAEAKLAAAKLYYFWNRTESPTNLSYHFARDFSWVLRVLPLGFGVVAPLGLVGIVLARRRWREHLALHLVLGITLLTGLLFFVSAEYRMPAVPVLLLFGAHAVTEAWDRLRGRKQERASDRHARLRGTSGAWGAWVGGLVLFAGLAVVCNVRNERLRFQSLKRVDYLNFGNLYKTRGNLPVARAMFERSLAIDPRYAPAYAGLAEVERSLGNEVEAARLAMEARRYRPADHGDPVARMPTPDELMLQAGELYQAKRYPEALERFEALRLRAESAADPALLRSTLNNIGLCRFQLGELDTAAAIFEALLAEDSTYVKAMNNLGKVRAAQHRTEEAAALFKRVLAQDPGNRIARDELTRLEAGPR